MTGGQAGEFGVQNTDFRQTGAKVTKIGAVGAREQRSEVGDTGA
jgi:hypothetical protein